MSFQSFHFLLFLGVLALAGYLLRERFDGRKNALLIASYYFYAMWDWRFLGALVWVTVVHYLVGLQIGRAKDRKWAKVWLWVGISLSLATLGYFKYFNFFVGSAGAFLKQLGLEPNLPMLEIVLPIGISFYTFQALSYTIDVYRGNVEPCRNPRDFALFVGFFATVLSGPITRAAVLLEQLRDAKHLRSVDANEGLILIARGIIKKVLFADSLALHIVNPAFSDPGAYSSAFLMLALYAYTFQIYMDLSGYTDIARGSAQVVGFRLPENFRQPYLAATLSNFWQRWHISMSSFFRDYLFFGVGGSRFGNVYGNLMITFVAIGLWHGAGWNFVLYGFIHGGVVCIERLFRLRREASGIDPSPSLSLRWIRGVLITFHIVVISRVLFRASDFSSASQFVDALLTAGQGAFPLSPIGAVALALAAVLHLVPERFTERVVRMSSRAPVWIQSGVLLGVVLVVVVFSTGEAPFVYFQF